MCKCVFVVVEVLVTLYIDGFLVNLRMYMYTTRKVLLVEWELSLRRLYSSGFFFVFVMVCVTRTTVLLAHLFVCSNFLWFRLWFS